MTPADFERACEIAEKWRDNDANAAGIIARALLSVAGVVRAAEAHEKVGYADGCPLCAAVREMERET